MLGVGLDWAEDYHDVALGVPGKGVIEQFRIDHGPAGVQRLVARCLALEPDPAEVRVVLETRHGLLVEALVDAGFTVLPVNPDLVARRRGPAKKKDDAEDARICCLLALDQYAELRRLVPHGALGAELRAIARDDERAARDERRLSNRLRADLLAVFPAAIDIADGDLGSAVFLRLLERWPSATELAAAGYDDIEALARANRHGWPDRFADRVAAALAEPRLAVRPELARAKAGSIRLAAAQLLLLRAQRRVWQHRMGEILLGGARYGRAKQPKDPQPENAFPGGEIYLSMPGLGDRLAARVAGEIGEHVEQFATPNALQCYAGRAPVTRRSGRSEYIVARRLAYNRYLGNAVQQWAFCSLRQSAWARQFYDAKIATGKSHNAALRALGNRWLEILWHCLRLGVLYDEATHTANRQRHHALAA
ncbi:IS110 family transposase [Micromonospora thermarum]|uniref:IS110 family transposase n=1 Tax=Micromonospora thermarum TaxID=2720024 RepID=A0ABX0Z9U1_9ACTN|nr:transposase [Micromonospora thermarum]NJP34622.1 IS110 family transposase [Micromonospora thermarum]